MDAFRAQDLPLPRVGVRSDTFSIIQTLLQDRRLLCMVARQLMQGRSRRRAGWRSFRSKNRSRATRFA